MKRKRTDVGCSGSSRLWVIVLAVVGIVWAANSVYKAGRSAALNGRFPKTLAFSLPEKTYDSKPYILGKIAIIDVGNHKVDDLWYELPEDRRANDDSEVGTIVFIKWSRSGEDAGEPDRGTWRADVTIVDPKMPAVVGRGERFIGGWKLEKRFRRGTRMVYPRPYASIVYYLTSLPRTRQKETTLYDLDPKAAKELDDLMKDLKEPPKRR